MKSNSSQPYHVYNKNSVNLNFKLKIVQTPLEMIKKNVLVKFTQMIEDY